MLHPLLEARSVPASCGMQLKERDCTLAELRRVRDLGVRWVRRGFIWPEIEAMKGSYDFSRWDELMAYCEELGLTVLGCISKHHPLYGHVGGDDGRAGYVRFAAACAQRYRGRDIAWEIWNEPNVRTFWGQHGMANTPAYAREYTSLVRAAAPAMREAWPDCLIAAGSVSCLGWEAVDPWMETCFAEGMLQSGIDAWSVHPYSLRRPEDYGKAYSDVRALMRRFAPEALPLMNSERGYPIGKAEGWAGGEGDQLQFQAWHLVRQYMNDLLHDVRMTSWYEWSGDEGFRVVDGERELPAHRACRVMLAQLAGHALDGRLDPGVDEDHVLRFTVPDGSIRLVAWTAPKPGQTPDQAVEHEVSIPVGTVDDVEVVDLDGGVTRQRASGGMLRLRLRGAPQYVRAGRTP